MKKTSLHLEIVEQVSSLATASFGLVAALAWNDAIKLLFARLFPQPDGEIWAAFLYAIILTIIVVIVTIRLGNIVNRIKEKIAEKKSR